MDKRDQIKDSLDFCNDIDFYKTADKIRKEKATYHELLDYTRWIKKEDKAVGKDSEAFLKTLDKVQIKEDVAGLKAYDEIFNDEEEMPRGAKRVLYELGHLLLCLITAFIIVQGITTYVGSYTTVSGSSMEETLHDQDVLIIDKLSYLFHDPKPFDVIVFEHAKDEYYTKRIIATPGQTVQIIGSEIFVDGKNLNESFGKEPMAQAGLANEPITLGEDEYFVLGDNRNHSSDSRDPLVGLIPRDKIIGRVFLRLYPFDQIGFIHHEEVNKEVK